MSATPPSRAEKRTLEQSNHTPVTIASYSVEPTEVTNVAQAGEDIKKEMGYSIFANRPDFIDTFFDKVDKQQCQHILDSLVVKGFYKPNARTRKTPPWAKLPRKPTDETSLYAPLIDVLNIITEQEGSTQDGLRLLWRDVHDKAPKTVLNEASTDTIPDVIGEYVANKAALTKAPWWYRIAILIKSTKATREDKNDPENPTLVQLLEYARQTFKEQPFRRFLFGITFHCADMTFWHFDRAGGIGSIMINIHDQPLTFIQCIASCVAMSPVELGFDPTFEAYDTKDRTTFKPWKIPSKLLEPGALSKKTLPRAHWVVSMPGAYRKSGDEREDFVLFAAVSLNHTEVMKGRAGRSWFARKRSEMEQKNLELCKTYVLKDNWHDSRNPAEGSMYKAQGDIEGIARMYSYETVHINGEKDSTINVRRGLIVPEEAKPMSLRKAVELMERPEEDYYSNCFQRYSNSLPVNYKEWLEWWTEENKSHPIYHRDHNRLLLSSYGHSITDFLDREELLVVFKDAINGHRILVEKKFLHQHINRRNIAISEEDSPNKGLLVHQDYTIADFENHSATADDTPTGTPAFMSVERLTGEFMFTEYSYTIDESDFDFENTDDEASEHNDSNRFKKSDPKDKQDSKAGKRHMPVHDLESFLWLLCSICITRQGPSTPREYDETSHEDRAAKKNARKLFEEEDMETLGRNKRQVFVNFGEFRRCVCNSFAPYFKVFEDLASKLHSILFMAYRKKNYDLLHHTFIVAIEGFEKKLKSLESAGKIVVVPFEKEMSDRAIERRGLHANVLKPQDTNDVVAQPQQGEPARKKRKISKSEMEDTSVC